MLRMLRRAMGRADLVCPVCGTPHEPRGELLICSCSEVFAPSALVRRASPETARYFHRTRP